MKKIIIILVVSTVILAGGYFVYNSLGIKPLMVEDIIGVESGSSVLVPTGVSFEDTIANVQQLGYLNWNRGEDWTDDNRYVDGKKRPLVVTVSNQQGPVPSQILTITDKEKIIKVYLPAISGEGGTAWAWFYIDSDGSSYWGCNVGETCDSGVKGSKRALREENVARKTPLEDTE